MAVVTDVAMVRRKLAELDRHRDELAEFRALTVAAYEADWKTQRIVERTLQIMIEICIDVAAHLIAEESLRVASSAADTFRALREAGVLDDDLTARLGRMVGFRNVVVHSYDAVDPTVTVDVLTNHMGDFEAFRDAIAAHVT